MKTRPIIAVLIIAIALSSCRQLKEMTNFAKCEFRLKSIENIQLAGFDVQNKKSLSDFSVMDAAKLMAAVAQNNFPLQFTLNVDVKNPNPVQGTLNKLDWILLIDDIQMVQGTTQNKLQIAPNGGVANYPLLFNINLRDVLKEKTGQSLINFGLNMAGAGNQPTRITLRAKPYVSIGNFQIAYPGYFDIKTEYTSK